MGLFFMQYAQIIQLYSSNSSAYKIPINFNHTYEFIRMLIAFLCISEVACCVIITLLDLMVFRTTNCSLQNSTKAKTIKRVKINIYIFLP